MNILEFLFRHEISTLTPNVCSDDSFQQSLMCCRVSKRDEFLSSKVSASELPGTRSAGHSNSCGCLMTFPKKDSAICSASPESFDETPKLYHLTDSVTSCSSVLTGYSWLQFEPSQGSLKQSRARRGSPMNCSGAEQCPRSVREFLQRTIVSESHESLQSQNIGLPGKTLSDIDCSD